MKINIEINQDKSKAYLLIDSLKNPDVLDVTPEQILEEVEKVKVVYGVKHHLLADICEDRRFDRSITIAVGEPPGEGVPARFEYLRRPCMKEAPPPSTNDEGEMDYVSPREGYLNYVKKGDLLVKLIPPLRGLEGTNILGVKIPGLPGQDRELKEISGQGTKIEDNYLVSAKDGFVYVKEKRIQILSYYEISSSIGMSTGSIDLPLELDLELIVTNDVSSGYTIKCRTVSIKGCIEDATVTAENLSVKEGIVGTGDTEIKAEYIDIGYVNTSKTIVGKHVNVKREISGGATVCGDTIKAQVIQGCTIYAKKAVLVNYLNGQITLMIGIDYNAKREYDKIAKELNRLKGPLEQLRNASYAWAKRINQLKQLAKSNPNHPLLQKELPKLKSVKEKHQQIEDRYKEATDEKDDYYEKMYPESNPFLLTVSGFSKDSSGQTVTEPDCFIHLGKSHMKVSDPGKGAHFYLANNDVVRAWKFNYKELKGRFEKIIRTDAESDNNAESDTNAESEND